MNVFTSLFLEELFYGLRNPHHLLTSWTLDNLHGYSFPDRSFGRCIVSIPSYGDGPAVSGDCITGGRSGYSVKMVSRSFLESEELSLGGLGEAGSLLNRPSEQGF